MTPLSAASIVPAPKTAVRTRPTSMPRQDTIALLTLAARTTTPIRVRSMMKKSAADTRMPNAMMNSR